MPRRALLVTAVTAVTAAALTASAVRPPCPGPTTTATVITTTGLP